MLRMGTPPASNIGEVRYPSHLELCATFRSFTKIIDEWRSEINSLDSDGSAEEACMECGVKENANNQLQKLRKATENQLQRVQKLQEIASAIERNTTRAVEEAMRQRGRIYYRQDLAERAVLGDVNAKNCIILGTVLDAAARDILNAAVCTFPDLPAQEDTVKTKQLESLRRHLGADGKVDLKGLLDDVYYLSAAEAQALDEPVLDWQRGRAYEEKALKLRERVFDHFEFCKRELKSQHKLIEVNKKFVSDSEARMDAKKAQLDYLRDLMNNAESQVGRIPEGPSPRQVLLGKRRRSSPVSNSSDLPSIMWGEMLDPERISRLEKEIQLLEDSINTANDKTLQAHAELSRLEPIMSALRRGCVIMQDEKMLIHFIINEDSGCRYNDQTSMEYYETMKRGLQGIANRSAVLDTLFGGGSRLLEQAKALMSQR